MRRRMGRAGARREGGRWFVSEDFLDVQQNARVALGKLAEEAKWAQAVSADSPTCPWPSCVELSVSADNPIKNPPAAYTVRFQWNSGAQQMERVEGATVTPLADSITGVVFRYLNRNGAATTGAAGGVGRAGPGGPDDDAYSDGHPHAHADGHADADGHRHPHLDADPRADGSSADPDGDPDAGADDPAGHRHLARHRHPDADPYSDADADADARPDSDPYGHGDAQD